MANEPVGAPEKYGDDRFFVYLRLEGDENPSLDREVAALLGNGHPVVRIDLHDRYDLGQEFLRWEVAIAAAGSAIGIHPFNQPDVQLARIWRSRRWKNLGRPKKPAQAEKTR